MLYPFIVFNVSVQMRVGKKYATCAKTYLPSFIAELLVQTTNSIQIVTGKKLPQTHIYQVFKGLYLNL
jgi:hypothetical protein